MKPVIPTPTLPNAERIGQLIDRLIGGNYNPPITLGVISDIRERQSDDERRNHERP